jgi:hypothetical protein
MNITSFYKNSRVKFGRRQKNEIALAFVRVTISLASSQLSSVEIITIRS